MAAATLHLFDRFEGRLGILPTVGAVTHAEELGGEDTIEFDCPMAPGKGDRLVWLDPEDGVWREHEVVRTDEPLGMPTHVYAESSVCECLCDFIEEAQLVSRTAAQAMAAILALEWGSGLKVRALLLEGGVMEFNYLDSRRSAVGAAVVQVFDVDPAGYASADARPWRGVRAQVKTVRLDSSLKSAGIKSCAPSRRHRSTPPRSRSPRACSTGARRWSRSRGS